MIDWFPIFGAIVFFLLGLFGGSVLFTLGVSALYKTLSILRRTAVKKRLTLIKGGKYYG